MPTRSMTGFARATGTLPDGSAFAWELRSVNGRGLDLRLRLPPGLDALEAPLKEAATARLSRGNVSASLSVKREDRSPTLVLDPAALERAMALVAEVAARLPGAAAPRPEAVLALPGVLRTEIVPPDEAAEAARRAAVAAGFATALDGLARSRAEEGARLHAVLATLLDEIAALRDAAAAEAANQPAAHRDRLVATLATLLDGERRVPEDRLASEVALLAAKSDVREELDRLAAHLDAAREMLREDGPVGRRLEFLTQEFGRESNTLGAKAGTLALTRLSLDLKAAVERLREQAANVE